MWKNCRGFTLIEVMISLMILCIVSTILLPILIQIYQEKVTIQEERQAWKMIDDRIQAWIYENRFFTDEQEEMISSTIYYVTFPKNDRKELKVCVRWNGANSRGYERCGSAKK